MNTITMIMTVLTLWLVMGLGFLSKYAEMRRRGHSAADGWKTTEGRLFVASVAIPLIVLIFKTIGG